MTETVECGLRVGWFSKCIFLLYIVRRKNLVRFVIFQPEYGIERGKKVSYVA